MKKTYGDDYNINKRYAFLEIDLQKEKSNEERDYESFYKYYKEAKKLYEKEEKKWFRDAIIRWCLPSSWRGRMVR